MIKTNLDSLVEISVMGEIANVEPLHEGTSFTTGYDGHSFIPLGVGGITYNVKVGDRAFNWAWGDHVQPGVCLKSGNPKSNNSLHFLSCLGNEATLVDSILEGKESKIKGSIGVITGKNSCFTSINVHFSKKVIEHLSVGDKIQVKASGQGLKLLDYPNISVMNCSPQLFKAMNPTEKGGRVRVPVIAIVPGKLIGAGIGSSNSFTLGFDIQSTSAEIIKEYKLENLRLGDLVAVADYDCTYGPRWQEGAITVGVVVHGASSLPGHGPGVSILFTSPEGLIEPVITRRANLVDILKLE